MTRDQIARGLSMLAMRLANEDPVPDGFMPAEWAYIKGVASGEILRLRDRLGVATSSPAVMCDHGVPLNQACELCRTSTRADVPRGNVSWGDKREKAE
jgi:hypothetical protein